MDKLLKALFNSWQHIDFSALSTHSLLRFLEQQVGDGIIFSSSFSLEDQVITHLIKDKPVTIFTIDTGRLFEETQQVKKQSIDFFQFPFQTYLPYENEVNQYVDTYGENAFYESLELRLRCCHIRKVEPLKNALKGYQVWITGLRAEHSPHRNDMTMVEWDEQNQIIKCHPLLYWTEQQVKEYIQLHNLPFNELYNKGYSSIGCSPCTRAIRPGEDNRAGRWWWETSSHKECGLHLKK